MSVILAVEPDKTQAVILRRLVGGQAGTELVVVTSAHAAIATIKRRVPDLVLLGASLGPKSQDVVDHLRSVSGAPNIQTLRIPPLQETDPEAFAAEIDICLARGADEPSRQQVDAAVLGIDPVGAGSTQDEEAFVDVEPHASDAAPIHPEVHYAHIALVQADAEARLASELERVRRDAAEQRAAEIARLQTDADVQRRAEVAQARAAATTEARDALSAEFVARDARAAAEQAAARALEAEAERVRRDADVRVQEELAHVRAEAEQTRRAQEEAQIVAEAARDAAMREARAAVEAAAAHAQEVEVARVRADAESRLHAEMARVQEEAQRARMAGESEIEQIRQDAERQALVRAQATLQAEIARARSDAEARLAAEVADARADAEHRRVADLAEVRAQLAQVHAAARQHARSAAAGAVSAEIARAKITFPRAAARVVAEAGSHAASVTVRAARIALRWLGSCQRVALPIMRDGWERLPAYTLPTVASLLLVVGGVAFVGVSSLTTTVTSSARSVSVAPAAWFGRTVQAVQESLASNEAPDTTGPQAQGVVDAPPEPTTPAEPAGSGMLAVFSRVPLDLYVSGRRIGTTDDGQILVPAGRYRVELVSTRLNYRGEVTLEIRPGAVTAHTVSLPDGQLQVNTETGVEVWIEGERAGVAPLGVVPVPIGTREILVRQADFSERREFVEVRYGEVTEVSIERREALDPATAYPLPRLDQPGAPIR